MQDMDDLEKEVRGQGKEAKEKEAEEEIAIAQPPNNKKNIRYEDHTVVILSALLIATWVLVSFVCVLAILAGVRLLDISGTPTTPYANQGTDSGLGTTAIAVAVITWLFASGTIFAVIGVYKQRNPKYSVKVQPETAEEIGMA